MLSIATSTSVHTDIECGCGYYVGSGCCAVSGVWLWALLVSVHTDIECGGGHYECYQCAEVLRRPPVHPQLYSDCGTKYDCDYSEVEHCPGCYLRDDQLQHWRCTRGSLAVTWLFSVGLIAFCFIAHPRSQENSSVTSDRRRCEPVRVLAATAILQCVSF